MAGPARRTRGIFAAALIACALFATADAASAQATCANGGIFYLSSNPPVLAYGTASMADVENGEIVMGSVTVVVFPLSFFNRDWRLCIRGEQARFGPGGKPIQDVEWQLPGSPAWETVSTGERLVASGTGFGTVDVNFRVRVGYGDRPGDYDALLGFVAARP